MRAHVEATALAAGGGEAALHERDRRLECAVAAADDEHVLAAKVLRVVQAVADLVEAFAGDEEEEEEGAEEGGEAAEGEAASPGGATSPGGTKIVDEDYVPPLEGTSLFCLGPDNGFRNGCYSLVLNANFDSFIILLIIGSSICLALDVPRLDPTSDLASWLVLLNYWFTGLFIGEMLLKIIAYGFLFTPKAYLKDGWSILDFIIVMMCMAATTHSLDMNQCRASTRYRELSSASN